MKAIDGIVSCFGLDALPVSERSRMLEAHFSFSGSALPSTDELAEALGRFPTRDTISVTLTTVTGESLVVTSPSSREVSSTDLKFRQAVSTDDELEGKLEIVKNITANTLSIYNFDSFSNWLISRSIGETIETFSDLMRDRDFLLFELHDSTQFFSTNTMIFKSVGTAITDNSFDRRGRVKSCREVSHFYNRSNCDLTPDDFNIITSDSLNTFKDLFASLKTLFAMIYIANTAYLDRNEIRLQIFGQKGVDFCYPLLGSMNNPELYRIYSWIYTDGNPVDKAAIARSIITLHCKFTQLRDTDEKTFASIQSNFAVYQRNNVSQYIELKNKLAEFIVSLVNQSGEIIVGFSDHLKNSVLAFFTFIITVYLANLASNGHITNVFTRDITILSHLILLGSVLYIIIGALEMDYKVEKIKEGYKALKGNYSELLDETDMLEIFKRDTFLDTSIGKVTRHKRVLLSLGAIMLLAVCIAVEVLSTQPVIAPHLHQWWEWVASLI